MNLSYFMGEYLIRVVSLIRPQSTKQIREQQKETKKKFNKTKKDVKIKKKQRIAEK